MQKAYEDGLVVQLKPGAVPQYKKYLQNSKGRIVEILDKRTFLTPSVAGRGTGQGSLPLTDTR